jgi:hypothetical protein
MDFLTAIETLPPQDALPLLQERYRQNLAFFSQTLPHLAAILQRPTTRYHLYLDSRGINVATQNGELLYPVSNGRSSLFDASRLWAHDLLNNKAASKYFNQKGVVTYDEPTIPVTTGIVNRIVETARTRPAFNNDGIYFGTRPLLPATVYFGLMAGLQLEFLQRNYDFIHTLFVYEPEPDFFAVSCHFVDYAALYSRMGEAFFLFVQGELSPHAVKKFYTDRLVTANYVRFEVTLYGDSRIEAGKQLFLEMQRQNTRGWGTLDDELVGLRNRLHNVNPKLPDRPLFTGMKPAVTPVCVVGNGPSLNALLPFIKANEARMLILSAGTALKPLKAYGIEPDFQIEIERRDHVRAVLDAAPLGQTPLLAADLIHPGTLEAAQEAYLFIRSNACTTAMHGPQKRLSYTIPLVGNAALALALEMGEAIYLCGMDAGFKHDGKQHAAGSFYDDRDDLAKEKIPVRGNLCDTVYTTPLLSLSRHTYEQALAQQPHKKVFNLSDGAYIAGAVPVHAATVKLPDCDKSQTVEAIKNACIKKGFFSEEREDYKEEIESYLARFFAVLEQPVATRRALYEVIDAAYRETEAQNRNASVSGTLLGGTLRHILNALFSAGLHLHEEALTPFFREALPKAKAELAEALQTLPL